MRKDQPADVQAHVPPPKPAPAGRAQDDRATALRANLLRRKQQSRARAAASKDDPTPCR